MNKDRITFVVYGDTITALNTAAEEELRRLLELDVEDDLSNKVEFELDINSDEDVSHGNDVTVVNHHFYATVTGRLK